MGVRQYAAEMLNVTARHPSGKVRMRSNVLSKVPHTVGKLSELTSAFTERMSGSSHGNDMSWVSQRLSEWDLGTKPSGEVWKGPIMDLSVSGK